MADTHVVNLPLAASPARGGTLFLYTPSEHPCGVEIFTRTLTAALQSSGGAYDLLAVSGHWRELPALAQRIVHANRVVFSFPLVAWKRVLILPLVLLLVAVVTRRRIAVVLHEWSALHWMRRAALTPFVLVSRSILVLSPYIRDQIARDRFLPGAAQKCRLIPHPPTIRRPERRTVSDIVRGVETAAQNCDMVIGTFGAIYKGKEPAALLDVAAHLRARGIRALVVLAGSFTRGLDNYEAEFQARVRGLGLDGQVIVTGYIRTEEELFALFQRMGVFLFLFPEGLTARRSSVIACLQSGRPVVVSAPSSSDEFRHHRQMSALIEAGAISFVRREAGVAEIADALLAAAGKMTVVPPIDADAWWDATTAATRTAL